MTVNNCRARKAEEENQAFPVKLLLKLSKTH